MMPRSTIDRRPENCRWSVLACWPDAASDRDDDFKIFWTCERVGTAVTADDCRQCPCWSPEHDHRTGGTHRRG